MQKKKSTNRWLTKKPSTLRHPTARNRRAKKPRAKNVPSKLVGSGTMVRLPERMHLLRVSDAEFETAKRIMARWMFEHPEIETLVLRRQDGRQANIRSLP